MRNVISWLFATLFFLVPLILWPYTSEVFEFNKIVLTYVITILVICVWAIRCVIEKKFIFLRTKLDIPLLIFLASQFISSIISIDPVTSWFGYYSRFNGGFLSTLSYSILYWAFVSNLSNLNALRSIKWLLTSSTIVCSYAVAQHFGIDKNIWVQDVQSRVFSTLGQPNWLAAWVVALMPIVWGNTLNLKVKNQQPKLQFKIHNWGLYLLNFLLFTTLLFTKSRSGLVGFLVASTVFWTLALLKSRAIFLKEFVIYHLSFVILALAIGTQFTPSLTTLLNKTQENLPTEALSESERSKEGPALETGGTESGTIRKIVWKGAYEIWKHYPITGSGVETFAFSYYKFRPAEHNLVSEWDYIYNKAHNEFLNIAANSGSIGLAAYMFLIGNSVYIFIQKLKFPNFSFQLPIKLKITNSKTENSKPPGDWKLETNNRSADRGNLTLGLLAGYSSLLVTNFFGFSVVPTQLLFFLFPAVAVALTNGEPKAKSEKLKLKPTQIFFLLTLLLFTFYLLLLICCYWLSDFYYAKAINLGGINSPNQAEHYFQKAIKISPYQSIYFNQLAITYSKLAVSHFDDKDAIKSNEYAQKAIEASQKAIELSKANINYKRTLFGIFVNLSILDKQYVANAGETLIEAIDYAPTDPKLHYNLALVYAQTNNLPYALSTLAKTIELKSNYKEARLAYAVLLKQNGNPKEAKLQLEYILKYIDPNDALSKQTLEAIN